MTYAVTFARFRPIHFLEISRLASAACIQSTASGSGHTASYLACSPHNLASGL